MNTFLYHWFSLCWVWPVRCRDASHSILYSCVLVEYWHLEFSVTWLNLLVDFMVCLCVCCRRYFEWADAVDSSYGVFISFWNDDQVTKKKCGYEGGKSQILIMVTFISIFKTYCENIVWESIWQLYIVIKSGSGI